MKLDAYTTIKLHLSLKKTTDMCTYLYLEWHCCIIKKPKHQSQTVAKLATSLELRLGNGCARCTCLDL